MGVQAAPLPLDVPDEPPDAPDDPLPVPPSSPPAPELDGAPPSSLPGSGLPEPEEVPAELDPPPPGVPEPDEPALPELAPFPMLPELPPPTPDKSVVLLPAHAANPRPPTRRPAAFQALRLMFARSLLARRMKCDVHHSLCQANARPAMHIRYPRGSN
jgi:hypothetical protein